MEEIIFYLLQEILHSHIVCPN